MATPMRWICALAAPVLALALGGCSGLLPTPPQPPPATFMLSPDLSSLRAPLRTTSASGVTLLVSRPEPSAGYGSARMAYLERDYRLDYFADHQWVDPPAAMLEPLLVQALGVNPAFGAVSSDGRGIRADLRLDTVIEAFYQDFRARPSRVRVALRVRLVDPGDGRILATRLFDLTEPAPADTAYGGVQAINRVLARLLPEVADFAAGAAPRQVVPP
jgi:cholesterol transport system auxiliary component